MKQQAGEATKNKIFIEPELHASDCYFTVNDNNKHIPDDFNFLFQEFELSL